LTSPARLAVRRRHACSLTEPKAAVKYLAACGATPISVVDHDGVASITQARSQPPR